MGREDRGCLPMRAGGPRVPVRPRQLTALERALYRVRLRPDGPGLSRQGLEGNQGLTPCTARKARLNASVEPYPKATAVPNRSRSPRTSAAATVVRRRRMYSDDGMPASDENIRRT